MAQKKTVTNFSSFVKYKLHETLFSVVLIECIGEGYYDILKANLLSGV